ncbi:hypothetical protein MTR_5g038700 [Medicago truncatula]|uniref:Uncharacterized protein n=1 Tax=Medicago truncatula TaxID=3880 RepID=G7KB31_MEDTR|nr:hypothetical protein MTR_5g038700 [Medicago truncatula]
MVSEPVLNLSLGFPHCPHFSSIGPGRSVRGGVGNSALIAVRFRYRTTHHLCPRTKSNSVGREGCVKSPTSDTRLYNMFISEGNSHLTSRFCGVVLGPTIWNEIQAYLTILNIKDSPSSP